MGFRVWGLGFKVQGSDFGFREALGWCVIDFCIASVCVCVCVCVCVYLCACMRVCALEGETKSERERDRESVCA